MSAAMSTPIPVYLPRSGASPGELSEQEIAGIQAEVDARKQRILARAGHFELVEALQLILKRAEISGDRWYADEARAALAKAGL